MKYKDFPKHDLRRCFTVLMAIERLGERATAHYISLELECTRAEVMRAIAVARDQLHAQVIKIGSSYRIDDWGVLDRRAVTDSMEPKSARESEDARLGSLVNAITTRRLPSSNSEADLFRLTAQLLRTRFPSQAMTLDTAARSYFAEHRIKPRPFPQMVSDGLIQDVPRFRHAIENRCAGVKNMVNLIEFAVDTNLSLGLKELLLKLEERSGLREPIKMFIAGGMATHLYTGGRVTSDVDAEFSKRIALPGDLMVETKDGNALYLDSTYNSTFALMHEDYLKDALRVPLGTKHIEVYVLSPVDLIVSKIARYNGPDPEDIDALITRLDIPAEAIEARALQAMAGFVGNLDYLRMNLRDVLGKARKRRPAKPPRCDTHGQMGETGENHESSFK